MMEKMSPQNCSRGGPSSEARDLTIRATIIGVSVGQSKHVPITFEFGEFLVAFSDEATFEIGLDTTPPWVRCKRGAAYESRNLKPTFKSGRSSVGIWG
jgi:hypothetical protein